MRAGKISAREPRRAPSTRPRSAPRSDSAARTLTQPPHTFAKSPPRPLKTPRKADSYCDRGGSSCACCHYRNGVECGELLLRRRELLPEVRIVAAQANKLRVLHSGLLALNAELVVHHLRGECRSPPDPELHAGINIPLATARRPRSRVPARARGGGATPPVQLPVPGCCSNQSELRVELRPLFESRPPGSGLALGYGAGLWSRAPNRAERDEHRTRKKGARRYTGEKGHSKGASGRSIRTRGAYPPGPFRPPPRCH